MMSVEQASEAILPPCTVLRVWNVEPQVQVTVVST
jgi:hypothetical protein